MALPTPSCKLSPYKSHSLPGRNMKYFSMLLHLTQAALLYQDTIGSPTTICWLIGYWAISHLRQLHTHRAHHQCHLFWNLRIRQNFGVNQSLIQQLRLVRLEQFRTLTQTILTKNPIKKLYSGVPVTTTATLDCNKIDLITCVVVLIIFSYSLVCYKSLQVQILFFQIGKVTQ